MMTLHKKRKAEYNIPSIYCQTSKQMELLDFKSQYEQSHYKQLQWKEFLCNQTYYQLKHLPYYLITRKSLSGRKIVSHLKICQGEKMQY